jgi:hypothetical protein
MNTGEVVNRRTIERNAAPWPYGVVAADLQSSVTAATDAGSVAWIPWRDPSGSDTRVGAFAVYALDDETVYLSPVYTRVIDDAAISGIPPGLLYVGDDPTRVIVSSRVAEYLPRHVADLAEARAAVALAIAEAHPWELLIHVDRRVAITELGAGPVSSGEDRDGDAGDEIAPALIDAYRAVDAMVARWLENASARTAVLVVGLAEQPLAIGEPLGWFAVASVVGDLGSWGPVTVDDLSATLAYLLSFEGGAGRAPLAAIAARFPLRSRFNARSFVDDGADVSVSANAKTLQELLGEAAAH